jgi:hypothetical protein
MTRVFDVVVDPNDSDQSGVAGARRSITLLVDTRHRFTLPIDVFNRLQRVSVHFDYCCSYEIAPFLQMFLSIDRLVAMGILPIDKDTIIYGSDDGGRTTHADDPKFNEVAREEEEKMNLI